MSTTRTAPEALAYGPALDLPEPVWIVPDVAPLDFDGTGPTILWWNDPEYLLPDVAVSGPTPEYVLLDDLALTPDGAEALARHLYCAAALVRESQAQR